MKKPTRILLIDDNALHANLTILAFESVHFQWCPRIHNAIEFLEPMMIDFDLVVCDYVGTTHDFDFEISALKQFTNAKVLVTSSHVVPLDGEGLDFVLKTELGTWLQRWLDAKK